jgi:hypothetical protein
MTSWLLVASLLLITNDELLMTSWLLVASLLLITNDELLIWWLRPSKPELAFGGFAFFLITNLVAEVLEARVDAGGNLKFDPFGNYKNYELGVGGEGNSEIDF